jgi:hypothetical protein
MYAILLLLTTVVSCVLLAPGLQDKLASVPFCKGSADDGGDTQTFLQNAIQPQVDSFKFDCSHAVGYLAVYRYYYLRHKLKTKPVLNLFLVTGFAS